MFVETKKDGEAPVQADPFKLPSLIAWLKTKNPKEAYCFTDNGMCLLSQYFTAQGYAEVFMFTYGFHSRGNLLIGTPPHFNRVAGHGDPVAEWTFGHALKRGLALTKTA